MLFQIHHNWFGLKISLMVRYSEISDYLQSLILGSQIIELKNIPEPYHKVAQRYSTIILVRQSLMKLLSRFVLCATLPTSAIQINGLKLIALTHAPLSPLNPQQI